MRTYYRLAVVILTLLSLYLFLFSTSNLLRGGDFELSEESQDDHLKFLKKEENNNFGNRKLEDDLKVKPKLSKNNKNGNKDNVYQIIAGDNDDWGNDKNLIFEFNLKIKMDEIESENNKRLERIEAVCRKYRIGRYKNHQQPSEIKHPPTPQYQVFFFDRANKWSLCPIYKAGSTSWLYNLLLLAGLTETQIEKSDQTLSALAREYYPELEPSTAEQELGRTLKVMTVRHPFERILSAYRDKLENINYGWQHGTLHFYKAFGQKMVKKYRPGGNTTRSQDLLSPADVLRNPNQPVPSGVEPTFQEFVRYLIDSNLVSLADDHWIPYYLYCTPCLLRYEFIAKTETLDLDQSYIIRVLGLNGKIKARWRHKTQFIDSGNHTQVSEVAKVYFHQLTTAQILQLYKTYRIDFELFGYDFMPYLKYAKDASS